MKCPLKIKGDMCFHLIDLLVKLKMSLIFFLIIFEQFIGDIIAKNPLIVPITGDFNVKSRSWLKNNLAMSERTQIDSLNISYGLSEIISDPTHILPKSFFCVDLICTYQSNLVTESGVHSYLHPK